MKKVIKIFLGSSITEFRYERMDIENFIRRISNDFEDRYNVKILPLLCESFDDALSKIRKQEEYNEKVRESDMCFFIFFTKAGEYTKEEFDAAREQFKKTGKPKIYTYFKVLGEEKAEDNLYDFMEELDKLLGHYYGTFDHIDTVKLRILLNLKLQEMDFFEIKAEEIALNDEEKACLHNTLGAICSGFPAKKTEAEEHYKKAIEISERLAKQDPERFESDLAVSYNNAGNFYKDHGNKTLAEEYYKKSIEIYERLAKQDPKRFEPDLARSYNNAGIFCADHGNKDAAEEYFKKAIEIRERLAKQNPERFESDLARSYNNAGIFYKDHGNKDAAEEYFKKAIEIYERLVKQDPERFESDLTRSYYNAGTFCYVHGNKTLAEEYFKKTIEIRERLAKQNPERFEPALAASYNSAGDFYYVHCNKTLAEEYFKKAIEIYERLVKQDPERFEPDLADSYNNAGDFYYVHGNKDAAKEYYKKALELAKKHPDHPYCKRIISALGNEY